MDKLTKYQHILHQEMLYQTKHQNPDMPRVQEQLVVNETGNRFLSIVLGWHNLNYNYFVTLDIELKEDATVWLHQNRTDIDIVQKLVKKGIAKADIIVAYAPQYADKAPANILVEV